MRHVVLAGFALLGAACACGSARAEDAAPRDDRWALLVGVTHYENLPKAKHLVGPGNDVVLFRKVLVERFGFRPDRITVLSEEEAAARGPQYLPTRANIAAGFAQLAKLPKAGDQAVILLAGHGAQQPEDKNAPDPELDGMDEIFLPRDTGKWDAKAKTVTNAIVDNDVAVWLKAIRDRKVSVWVTFDSCHSGSMMRRASREWPRDLLPVSDLGVPPEEIDAARKFAEKRNANLPAKARSVAAPERHPPFRLAKEGGVVAFYACQPNEVTYETSLPGGRAAGSKVHGLLTYAICRVLTESSANSRAPITYGELARRIQMDYLIENRRSPTPMIEGEDRDRTILGDKVWPGRSAIALAVDADKMMIDAGALHGLTTGSILAVHPIPGQGDDVLGHVRIRELGAAKSTVEPCEYEKKPLVTKLPDGGVCTTAFVDAGDLQIRVAVDPHGPDGKSIAADSKAKLDETIKEASGPESLIKAVDRIEDAEWLVRVRDGAERITANSAGDGKKNRDVWVSPRTRGAELPVALRRVARAENLKRLAAAGMPLGDDGRVRVDVKMAWVKPDNRTEPVTWPAPTVEAFEGDKIAITIRNTGKVAADVTLLYVTSKCDIVCLYPRKAGELNRFRPGDTHVLPTMRFEKNDDSQEHLVVIATKGEGQPVDFKLLEQSALPVQRGPGEKRTLGSPLGRLLSKGLYGEGKTRGLDSTEIEDCRMGLIPFDLRKERRPDAAK